MSLRSTSGVRANHHGGRWKKRPARKKVKRVCSSCEQLGFIPSGRLGGDCRACNRVAPSGQGGSWVFRAPVHCHLSWVTVLRRWGSPTALVCHTDGQRGFMQRNEGSGGLACTKVVSQKEVACGHQYFCYHACWGKGETFQTELLRVTPAVSGGLKIQVQETSLIYRRMINTFSAHLR